MRLVIDLSRSENKYLQSHKFKYEGLPTLLEMFEKEFWLTTFDLESGHHHIYIDIYVFMVFSQRKATIFRFQSFAFRFVLGMLSFY